MLLWEILNLGNAVWILAAVLEILQDVASLRLARKKAISSAAKRARGLSPPPLSRSPSSAVPEADTVAFLLRTRSLRG